MSETNSIYKGSMDITIDGEPLTIPLYEKTDGTVYTTDTRVEVTGRIGGEIRVEKMGHKTPEERIRRKNFWHS